MIALTLLALILVSEISSLNVAEEAKEAKEWDQEEINGEKKSPATVKLGADFDRLLEIFNCAIKSDDCGAWRAVNLITDWDLKKPDCDKAGTSDWCDKAREVLGDKDKGLSHSQIMDLLVQKADGIFDKEHGSHVNEIFKALGAYICFKVPTECKIASTGLKEMHGFEKEEQADGEQE